MLREQPFYFAAFVAQVVCYAFAVLGILFPAIAARVSLIRLSAFFVLVNAAAFKALLLWLGGSRLEVWEPTRRPG